MEELFTLGALFVSDFLKDEETPAYQPVELKLLFDEDTTEVRLETPVDPNHMYGRYWYRSGTNATMTTELGEIVSSIKKSKKLNDGDVWLDIASNDGTLLSQVPKNLVRIGIDPADDSFVTESAGHADSIVQDFFSAAAYRSVSDLKASVVTCIAMFYDLDNPDPFLNDVHEVMADDGLFVLQMSYSPLMVRQTAFDNICLAAGELVVTDRGNRPIEEIQDGDLVLTHRGRFRKVMRTFRTPAPDEMIRLRAYGAGHDLVCTKNHPLHVQRDGEWTFIDASDVRVGDLVSKPIVKEAPDYVDSIPMNENMAKIAGYYLAEGSYNKHKDNGVAVGFSFNSNETDTHIAELVSCLKAEGFSANLFSSPGTSVTTVSTYGDIAKWLYRNFGHHALRKRVPMWMMGQSETERQAFLLSYMNGDGYIYRDNCLRASTVGKDIAHGISLVANSLGYRCSITKCKKNPNGVILGRQVKVHDLWDIVVSTAPPTRNGGKMWMDDDYQVMAIRKIELVESDEDSVYNLEVDEDNTYVTPAMTTHNCHEHIFYYTLTTIKARLQRAGFVVVDCQLNDVNGGSFRVYVMKRSGDITKFASQPYRDVCKFRVDSLLKFEELEGWNGKEKWLEFFEQIQELKEETVAFIKSVKAEGKSVWGYGASTKGNTLLQYFGLDNTLIDGIAERSPYKYGLRTVGTNIPIESEEVMRAANPDYLLVLPWHFISEFVQREQEYLKAGGKFIVPCPEFRVIGA